MSYFDTNCFQYMHIIEKTHLIKFCVYIFSQHVSVSNIEDIGLIFDMTEKISIGCYVRKI